MKGVPRESDCKKEVETSCFHHPRLFFISNCCVALQYIFTSRELVLISSCSAFYEAMHNLRKFLLTIQLGAFEQYLVAGQLTTKVERRSCWSTKLIGK
jgi:hypothetical protein